MNKLGHTQSTIATGVREFPRYNPKEGQSALKNPFNQTLPLKFPKRAVIRHLPNNILTQTMYSPHHVDKNPEARQSGWTHYSIAATLRVFRCP